MGCNDVEVVISDQVTAEVTNTNPVTAVQTIQPDTTVETVIGEVSWKEVEVEVDAPTQTVTHEKLKKALYSEINVDGQSIVWAKRGITQNIVTGTLDFTASGIEVVQFIIFRYK